MAVRESLNLVGLSGFETRNVEQLSAGEKQRLAIASVLSMSPGFLLLDEPTAQLDVPGKERLVQILRGLKDKGHTLLIADHDLKPFSALADRFLIIESGRISRACDKLPLPFPTPAPYQPPQENHTADPSGDALIHLKDLYLSGTNGHPVFGGINVEFYRGTLVHVLGQNGAGKSTLLRCIAGQIRPDGGRIHVSGIRKLKPDALLGKMSFLFQNPERQLFEETVTAEVAFSLKRLGLPSQLIHTRVMEALSLCEADHLRNRSPLTLSFGEQHRVALASVIAPSPDILLLDEPFAGLDFPQRHRILRILARLREERTTMVLMASHENLPDENWADRTLLLEGGKLEAV